MKDVNAQTLLREVMGWTNAQTISSVGLKLQLMAEYKYDSYQQFGPGRRFVESLALWLNQFDPADRVEALSLVQEHLIFVSSAEMTHLVELAFRDVIVPERMRIVAEENSIRLHKVGALSKHPRFEELGKKSLYLGLSDGALTNELRRSSSGGISNEQIWQAYELGEAKSEDMLEELRSSLGVPDDDALAADHHHRHAKFNLIWLVDDFSGSGNTYIRYDSVEQRYKGKISKIYKMIHEGGLVETDYYDVSLLLYVATRQAIDHIEYWSERFTTESGYKPLKLHVLCPIEKDVSLAKTTNDQLRQILLNPKYYDHRSFDKHFAVGGTTDAKLGFAGCALPLVLFHNSPNNSVYVLWGSQEFDFSGLFPRVSRHREV